MAVAAERYLTLAAWSMIALSCLIACGNAAEYCDIFPNCPSRIGWVLAGSLIAAAIAAAVAVTSVFGGRRAWMRMFNLAAAAFIFVWLAAVAAVATSLKTDPNSPTLIGFTMFALFLSWLVLLHSLLDTEWSCGGRRAAKNVSANDLAQAAAPAVGPDQFGGPVKFGDPGAPAAVV